MRRLKAAAEWAAIAIGGGILAGGYWNNPAFLFFN